MYWRQVVSRDVMSPEFNRLYRGGRSFSGNERNCCFLNTGAVAPGYVDISAVSGFDFPEDGRALGIVDWDQDGDVDLWVSSRNAPRLRFLKNDLPRENHFLALRLHGNGTTTNRDAIGARVEIILQDSEFDADATASPPRLVKTLHAGEGFLSQSSKWLHFGLGAATQVKKIVVRWQGKEVESFTDVDADGRYELFQGTGQARHLEVEPRSLQLVESITPSAQPAGAERIPLVSQLPVPKLMYLATDGSSQPLPVGQGKPVLVNLWATWCVPCRKELAEFAHHEADIRQKNLEVVALCVDGINGPAAEAQALEGMIKETQFPFVYGTATADLVDQFQNLQDILIKQGGELPVPASFLIDERGRLSVIYKGPLAIDDLFADLEHGSLDQNKRYLRSARYPGRLVDLAIPAAKLEHLELSNLLESALRLKHAGRFEDARKPLVAGLEISDRTEFHSNLGAALLAENRVAEAQTHLEQALELDPDYAAAHMNLGIVYTKQGHLKDAVAKYHRAIELVPDFPEARFNLAKLLIHQGSIEEGILQYQEMLQQNPELAGANYELAGALQKLGRLDKAITHYQRAVGIKPDFARARNDMGVALAKQNRLQEAAAQFEHALRIQPDYTEASTNLQRARSILGGS